MTVGLAMAWPGMPAGRSDNCTATASWTSARRSSPMCSTTQRTTPAPVFDHFIAKPGIGRGHDQLVGLASTNDSDS